MVPHLMFHELGASGRQPADTDPGYLRYVVASDVLARRLEWMASEGLPGVSVGTWHRGLANRQPQVVLTFDDGCATDWEIAAPQLARWGFTATFYVVSGWIGHRRGFLTTEQLRALHHAGFEIGSHSATHAFLSDLDEAGLRREIVDSKHAIEDMLGAPVAHFSCPGGRWSRQAAAVARRSGYETMATSRLSLNDQGTDPFALGRWAVMHDTSDDEFTAICRGTGLRRRRAQQQMLAGAKRLLGTRLYTGLRRYALRQPGT